MHRCVNKCSRVDPGTEETHRHDGGKCERTLSRKHCKSARTFKVAHSRTTQPQAPLRPPTIMSDREGHSGGIPAADDDLSLPKATVTKMITGEFGICTVARFSHIAWVNVELLPNEVTCAKETRDLIIECCVGEQYSSVCWDDNSKFIRLAHARRVYSLNIIGSKRDMRTGVKEDNSSRTYHRCTQSQSSVSAGPCIQTLTCPQRLGFDSFTSEVEDVLKDHKQQQKVCLSLTPIIPCQCAEVECRTRRRRCPSSSNRA